MFLNKEGKLFAVLGCFFIANALTAEIIGVKIFSVEEVFGFQPLNFTLFGIENLSLNMSAGVLIWPFVFIITDILNEYFGRRGVRFLSYLTVLIIFYAFLMIVLSIQTPGSDFWLFEQNEAGEILNRNWAYNAILGQGAWIIVGSMTAFLLGQLLDVYIFQRIKKMTGAKFLWLRAQGSTFFSQMIDSFVVGFIAFYLNPNYDWPLLLVTTIALVNYMYKMVVAILFTPLLYVIHGLIDNYLGKEKAEQMVMEATNKN